MWSLAQKKEFLYYHKLRKQKYRLYILGIFLFLKNKALKELLYQFHFLYLS